MKKALGTRHLAFGAWHLALGIWRSHELFFKYAIRYATCPGNGSLGVHGSWIMDHGSWLIADLLIAHY